MTTYDSNEAPRDLSDTREASPPLLEAVAVHVLRIQVLDRRIRVIIA